VGDAGSVFASQCLYPAAATADGSSGLAQSVRWSVDLLQRDHPNGWLLTVFVRAVDRARHQRNEQAYRDAVDRLADVLDNVLVTLSGDAQSSTVVALASPYSTTQGLHVPNSGFLYVRAGSRVKQMDATEVKRFSDVTRLFFPVLSCAAKPYGTGSQSGFVQSWQSDPGVWFALSGTLVLFLLFVMYLFCIRVQRQVNVVRSRRYSPQPVSIEAGNPHHTYSSTRVRCVVKHEGEPTLRPL
jgi:hypothetical protein